MLNASDVHRHPLLDVTVCGSCRFLVIEKNRLEVNTGHLFADSFNCLKIILVLFGDE